MKLKTLLKESNAWDRNFGEPLPTLEDTRKAYALKQENLNEKDQTKDTKQSSKNTLGKSPMMFTNLFSKKNINLTQTIY